MGYSHLTNRFSSIFCTYLYFDALKTTPPFRPYVLLSLWLKRLVKEGDKESSDEANFDEEDEDDEDEEYSGSEVDEAFDVTPR